jgi:hypothetical protein
VSKRVPLGASTDETARLADQARQIQQGHQASAAPGDTKTSVISINIPLALVADMRAAADRRALRLAKEHPKGRGGRPSVSAIVTEILLRHRDEIEGIG